MIRDWDVWPFLIADGAGPVAMATYVLTRQVEAIHRQVGMALYPAVRALAVRLRKELR